MIDSKRVEKILLDNAYTGMPFRFKGANIEISKINRYLQNISVEPLIKVKKNDYYLTEEYEKVFSDETQKVIYFQIYRVVDKNPSSLRTKESRSDGEILQDGSLKSLVAVPIFYKAKEEEGEIFSFKNLLYREEEEGLPIIDPRIVAMAKNSIEYGEEADFAISKVLEPYSQVFYEKVKDKSREVVNDHEELDFVIEGFKYSPIYEKIKDMTKDEVDEFVKQVKQKREEERKEQEEKEKTL